MVGGALATAGGLLFAGESDGWFKAYDAATATSYGRSLRVLASTRLRRRTRRMVGNTALSPPAVTLTFPWQRHYCLHGRLIASSGQAQCPLLSPFRTLRVGRPGRRMTQQKYYAEVTERISVAQDRQLDRSQ